MSTSESPQLVASSRRAGKRVLAKPALVCSILISACSLLAATAVGASVAGATRAGSAVRGQSANTVKPDFAYYRGKTINLYTFASVGQAVDLEERILAPYIGAYLHCQIIVHNVSGGGALPGQNIPATAPPDGLTIGQANLVGDIGDFINNTPGLEFSLRSIPFLYALGGINTVFITTPASGLTTFQQLVNSTAPIAVLAAVGSSGGTEEQLLYGAYHIPNKFIYGYAGASQVLQGFARGDGEATSQAYSSVQALVVNHQAIPVLQSLPPTKGETGYSIMRKVPDLAQFAAAHPPKTKDEKAELGVDEALLSFGNPFFVPTGTPAKFQAALNDAIQFAVSRGGVKAQLLQNGLPETLVSPVPVRKAVISVISQQTQMGIWLKATGGT